MKVLPSIENNKSKYVNYAVLLSNGEVLDIVVEFYDVLSAEESNEPVCYRFYKEKKVVLELEGNAVKAIVSKSDQNWEMILKAIRKPKVKRKPVVK